MRRETWAALLFALLLIISFLNIRAADKLTFSLLSSLEQSQQCAEAGDAAKALEHFNSALALWLESDSYTHIFIRHSEIDSTSDAFYELQQQLESEPESSAPAYARLRYHLLSIRQMEHPRPGSIF